MVSLGYVLLCISRGYTCVLCPVLVFRAYPSSGFNIVSQMIRTHPKALVVGNHNTSMVALDFGIRLGAHIVAMAFLDWLTCSKACNQSQ